MNKNILFDKDISMVLKGIGIIVMVIYHFFAFPDFYVKEISYSYLLPYIKFIGSLKGIIIIAIFPFITGWAYYYYKDKSYKYSLKKIIIFLLDYWLVYIFLFLIILFICDYKPDLMNFLLGLFGLNGDIIVFNWYVYFYIFMMLFFPVYEKYFPKKNFFFDFFVVIVFCFMLKIVDKLTINSIEILECATYLSSATMGYLCAKYQILNSIYYLLREKICNATLQKLILTIIIIVLFLVFSYRSVIGINTGTFYVPILIIGLIIFNIKKCNIIYKLLYFLGKYSMNIWFLHGIFLGATSRDIFQIIAYWPRNPILVVIWSIFICAIISIFIQVLQNKMNYYLKKYI